MVSILGHLFVGMLTLGVAHAEEGTEGAEASEETQDGGIQKLLDAIPEIEAKKTEEDKPKAPQILDYRSYNRLCANAVMPNFKPPRSAVKKIPDIELELLVGVDLEGNMTAVSAGKRSGVTAFDKAALKALNNTGTLPAPPKGWDVEKDRVILTFRGR